MKAVTDPIYCGNFKNGRFDGTGIKLQDYDVNLIYSVNNVIEMGMLPTNDVNDYVDLFHILVIFQKETKTALECQ